MSYFNKDSSWEKPPGLQSGNLAPHDMSILNANDGRMETFMISIE